MVLKQKCKTLEVDVGYLKLDNGKKEVTNERLNNEKNGMIDEIELLKKNLDHAKEEWNLKLKNLRSKMSKL